MRASCLSMPNCITSLRILLYLSITLILCIRSLKGVNNITSKARACVDFNYGASQAALAGLYNVYVCPKDGVSREICNETFSLKDVSSISQSHISWRDIVLYMLVGPNSLSDAFFWWLKFVIADVIDVVIVGDACPGNQSVCNDKAHDVMLRLNQSHKLIHSHMIRSYPSDNGIDINRYFTLNINV